MGQSVNASSMAEAFSWKRGDRARAASLAVHQDDDKERVVDGERRSARRHSTAAGRDDHERTGGVG
jgi:hypothetical protein